MDKLHPSSPETLKIQELTGYITHKEPYKVYHKDSPYQGNQCYKLQVILKNQKEPVIFFIYPNLVPPPIFQTIEQSHYIDKRYLFFCEKKKRGWILHNWQEINFSKIANHAQEK